MADSDNPDIKVKIASEADTKGFQQAAAAGKQLKIDTSDLSDETKRQLGLLPELEAATKKSALAVEFETFRRRELGKVLLEVGNAAGISGKALSELAGGPIGAALALVGAYEAVKKSLDDADKKMDELLELAAQPMGTGAKGLQEAWDDAATAIGKYHAALADGNGEDPIKKDIERTKELTLARLEGQKKIAEAMGDTAAVARINEAIENTTVSSFQEEQSRREKAAKELSPEQAIKDEAEAKRKFNSDQKQLAYARDVLDPKTEVGKRAADSRQEALDKLEAAKNQPDTISGMGEGPDIDNRAAKARAIATAQGDFDKANNAVALAKRNKEQLEHSEPARQQAVTEAGDRRKFAEANSVRLKELSPFIQQKNSVNDLNQHSEKVVEILNQHGGALGKSLKEMGQAAHMNNAQIETMANAIVEGHISFAQRMARLEAQVRAQNASGK